MSPAFSNDEWEKRGTDEPDTRYKDGMASDSPMRTGYVLPWVKPAPPAGTAAPASGHIDPQPFNPNFQINTGLTDCLNVKAFGALGNGVNDDTGPLQAACVIASYTGQPIYIPAGSYLISGMLPLPPTVTLRGAGPNTVLNYVGNSDCIFMQNTTPTGGPNGQVYTMGKSGTIRDLTIDGTNAGASAVGLHTDSLPERLFIDQVTIQNFTGASAIALHMSNSISYTENYKVRVQVYNCTQAAQIEKLSGGSESFRYGELDIAFFAFAGQTGIVMQGCHLDLMKSITFHANMMGSSSAGPANWAFLYLSPTAVGGTYAQILDCGAIDFHAEEDLGALGNYASTILFGSSNNVIQNCLGSMRFQNNWTASNVSGGQFTFAGLIGGDANLVAHAGVPAAQVN
jgi:Pectate lyase superfamily protein